MPDIPSYPARNRTLHIQDRNTLPGKGYRLISLSMYGDSAVHGDELYASVWRYQPSSPQIFFEGYSIADFITLVKNQSSSGYYPTIVTASGAGQDVRCSGALDQFPDSKNASSLSVLPKNADQLQRSIDFDVDLGQFNKQVSEARNSGRRLRSTAVYGYSGQPYFIPVWESNTYLQSFQATAAYQAGVDECKLLAWNCDGISETPEEYQQRFDAQKSQWARPAFVTFGPDQKYFSLFYDDQIGSWVALHNMTADAYAQEFDTLTKQGFYPLYLQAGGSAGSARYAALFAKEDKVQARALTVTGEQISALSDLDSIVERYMRKDAIRAAALAVSRKGRMLFARGYTIAEPNYPVTEPNTVFRIASCSKALTSVAVHALADSGALNLDQTSEKLTDNMQAILGLVPPPGKTFPAAVNAIEVQHLVAMTAGLPAASPDVSIVVAAYNEQLPLRCKKQWESYDLATALTGTPNKNGASYSNGSYTLLGLVVEAKEGTTYETATRQYVLTRAGVSRPFIGQSAFQDRAANEVFYHDLNLQVGKSVLIPSRPLVAYPYGVGDTHLSDAFGGWVGAAPDFVRIFDCLQAGASILKNKTLAAFLANTYFDKAGPVPGKPEVTQYIKGGGMSGTGAALAYRTDGISWMIVFNTDTLTSIGNTEDLINPVLNGVSTWPDGDLYSSLGINTP
jgi:CubicO group peptidase (beta-lactamase class C family)